MDLTHTGQSSENLRDLTARGPFNVGLINMCESACVTCSCKCQPSQFFGLQETTAPGPFKYNLMILCESDVLLSYASPLQLFGLRTAGCPA
jgi:hypothetical protein